MALATGPQDRASAAAQVELPKRQIKQATDEGRFDEIPSFLQRVQALTRAEDHAYETPPSQKYGCAVQKARKSTNTSTRTSASGLPPLMGFSPSYTPSECPSLASESSASGSSRRAGPGCSGKGELLLPAQAPGAPESPSKRPGTAPGGPGSDCSSHPPSAAAGARRQAPPAPWTAAGVAGAPASARASSSRAAPSDAVAGASICPPSQTAAGAARPISPTSSTGSPPAAGSRPPSPGGSAVAGPALPSRPYGHLETAEGRLERLLPPGEVHPRQAKIFSQTHFMGSSVWRPEEWLQMRQQALTAGRTDQLVPLLQAVRASTEKATQEKAYEVAVVGDIGRGQRVNLRSVMPISPDVAWCRRDGLSSMAPPPQLGNRTPRMQVGGECPLDAAIRLNQASVTAPIFLAVEVRGFTSEGLVDTRSMQALAPDDLLLRTDLGRFLGHLHDSCCSHRGALNRKLARDAALPVGLLSRGAPARGDQAPLREELTAFDDPSVIVCRQVTIFRGPLEEGYPFLREPMHVTVLLTALPSQNPHVTTLRLPDAGQAEWYNDHREQEAVAGRLDLLAELARREANCMSAADPDPSSASQLPVLLLCPPGSGAPRRQPYHSVAYALKFWRLRFGACFGSVHLCCRDRREPAPEMSHHWSSVINEDEASHEAANKIIEPSSLLKAVQDIGRALLPGSGAAGAKHVHALPQREAQRHHQVRLEQEAERSLKPMRGPEAALRKLQQSELAGALVPAAGAESGRPESRRGESASPCSSKDSSSTSSGDCYSEGQTWTDFLSIDTEPQAHSSYMSVGGSHDTSEHPAARRRKSCEVDCRAGGRSHADWDDEQTAAKLASMRTLSAQQSLKRRAQAFAQGQQGTNRQKRKELDQVRKRTSVKVALGEDQDTVLAVGAVGTIRPAARVNGTMKHDPDIIYGAFDVKDFKPNLWGHGDDARQASFETGRRQGEYEQLRAWHRRRLSQPRVAKDAEAAVAVAAAAPPLDSVALPPAAAALPADTDSGEEVSRSATSNWAVVLDSPAAAELILRAPAGQISTHRHLLRQRASVFAVARKLEDAADDHHQADKDATRLEGSLLLMARGLGDKLHTARGQMRGTSASGRWA